MSKQWRYSTMILYHGSNIPIDSIDLKRCRPYKDFGRGFYLTDIEEQAQRMASRIAKMFHGVPSVTAFEFDIDMAVQTGLDIKRFDSPTYEWAKFVMKNRSLNEEQPCHNHDIVIGPVADDTISQLLRMFTENYISEQQLLKELTFSKVTSQYLFHTEAAIKTLKRL